MLVETVGHDSIVATWSVNQAVVTATHAQATRDLTGLADVDPAPGRGPGPARPGRCATRPRPNAALARDRTQVADTRLTASVTGTDLSLVVLDAYWRAAARMATLQPACRLSWPTLAGIGRVESGNGTFGGDEVGADGEEATPIIGIPLDGTNGTQRITDTDGGALDHDAVYDRAVGPMQVLPSAWRRYGLDGNGDGQRRSPEPLRRRAHRRGDAVPLRPARHRRRPAARPSSTTTRPPPTWPRCSATPTTTRFVIPPA